MRYTLHKREILRGNENFRKIISSGSKIFGKNILCFYLIDENSIIKSNRILAGFTVSKKVGNAVVRNRIKRLIRESYRLSKSVLYETETMKNFVVSMVFIYNSSRKNSIKNINLNIIKPELENLLEQIRQKLITKDSA